jgi:hypothetical protein
MQVPVALLADHSRRTCQLAVQLQAAQLPWVNHPLGEAHAQHLPPLHQLSHPIPPLARQVDPVPLKVPPQHAPHKQRLCAEPAPGASRCRCCSCSCCCSCCCLLLLQGPHQGRVDSVVGVQLLHVAAHVHTNLAQGGGEERRGGREAGGGLVPRPAAIQDGGVLYSSSRGSRESRAGDVCRRPSPSPRGGQLRRAHGSSSLRMPLHTCSASRRHSASACTLRQNSAASSTWHSCRQAGEQKQEQK